MEVKEVIISALKILGRSELAASLSADKTLTGENSETVNTLVYCFNAVEDELARKYMPLTYKEEFSSLSGKFSFTNFTHAPVKIIGVTVDGKEADYELFPEYIAVDARKITVEYGYAPSGKTIDGSSDFGAEVSEYLLALGTAAEYCLINGEIEWAEIWEKKYRAQIDRAQSSLPSGGSIPPRRWV